MLVNELLKSAGYRVEEALGQRETVGICTDSRRVRQGEIFVALSGLSHDGHLHVGEALSRGAVLIVSERHMSGAPVLVVESTRVALARLFDAWYGHPARGLCMIGITGTNGKTSTAAMLAAILEAAGRRVGVIGTVNATCCGEVLVAEHQNRLANLTTPDPAQLYRLLAQMKAHGADTVVMEVTSHALFFEKVAPLYFKRALFTNLSPEHLDLHGDMDTYFAEKRRLFLQCEMGVISTFAPYGQMLADSLDVPFFTVGRGNVTRVVANGVQGVSFRLCHEGENIDISLPVPGDFSVENAALAALTACTLGVSAATVKEALAGFGGVVGRMERVSGDRVPLSVFIDYAHTPDAIEKLLLAVRRFRADGQRVILVFGCGGDRDRTKRRKMGRVATRLADLTVITSDNARSEEPLAIIADIVKGIDKEKPHTIIPDRKEAIAYAIDTARDGDIVILAGKGHEEYEIKGRERLRFSEREIVAACLAARFGEGTV